MTGFTEYIQQRGKDSVNPVMAGIDRRVRWHLNHWGRGTMIGPEGMAGVIG